MWTRRVVDELQAGCLPLRIELGYTSPKTPIEDRICKLYNDGDKDQEQFLFYCSCLRETRSHFFHLIHSDFLK